jgi:signal transduction histidine kinase
MAFFILIALPILLLTAAAGTIVSLQLNNFKESYDVEADSTKILMNPVQILNRLSRATFNEIKLAALRNPKRLEDMEYIDHLNEELHKKYSFIVMRKGEEFVYIGSQEHFEAVKRSLQHYGARDTIVDGGLYVDGKIPFLIKAQDFIYSDGSEGTAFVITDMDTLFPQIKTVMTQCVTAFLIIWILTAVILMFWIYQSILRPLNILRTGMNRIKEGDLEYSLEKVAGDEIGQLCEDFEDMRIRLKELIDSRLRYEEDIKDLISNISHDLKTPLTAIQGYAEGLKDGVADTPYRQSKYLQTILSKAKDMSTLVDELSFYAKIDSNTIPYTFKDINIREYFDDCVEEINLDLEMKKIEVQYHNDIDEDTTVIADAEQLKRVINNIVGNSIKYMDKRHGILQIRLEDMGAYVQVEIEDNGSGIPKADIPFIFDRFFRADASRNSKKGGSGLGLAISRKIIEDHSGKIWAESGLGVGTTIFFTLKKNENNSEKIRRN